MRSAFSGVLAILLLLPSAAAGAGEEGIFCGDLVESGIASGDSRQKSEEAAISWWSSRAGSKGKGYQLWLHARDKKIECKDGGRGTFRCVVAARPCLPPGTTPENVPRLDL